MQKQSKSIGILVTIFSGFGEKGFYHSQEKGLAKELAAKGNKVTVYKCVDEHSPETTEIINDSIVFREIAVKRIGVHGIFDPTNMSKKHDAIFMFSDTQLVVPHVRKFCQKHKITFIPYVGIARSTKQKKLKSILTDLVFKAYVLPTYRDIPPLVKTEGAKKEMRKLGVYGCEIAPAGLDIENLKTDFRGESRETLRKEFGFEADDIILSFIAKIEEHKRPLDAVRILDSVRENPSFKLIIAGEGKLMADMKNLILERGLNDRVKILGKLPQNEIWKVHYISDYYLNLSRIEIFGMAVMEAVYYESFVFAMNSSPGPTAILSGIESSCLCENDNEITMRLKKGETPGKETLEQSSEKIIDRCSWECCANLIEKRID